MRSDAEHPVCSAGFVPDLFRCLRFELGEILRSGGVGWGDKKSQFKSH